jgi:hypothetical protein
MTEQNNILYIGQEPAKEGIFTHQQTIDGNHRIESAVLAGPVTFSDTVVVEGNLVVV